MHWLEHSPVLKVALHSTSKMSLAPVMLFNGNWKFRLRHIQTRYTPITTHSKHSRHAGCLGIGQNLHQPLFRDHTFPLCINGSKDPQQKHVNRWWIDKLKLTSSDIETWLTLNFQVPNKESNTEAIAPFRMSHASRRHPTGQTGYINLPQRDHQETAPIWKCTLHAARRWKNRELEASL